LFFVFYSIYFVALNYDSWRQIRKMLFLFIVSW